MNYEDMSNFEVNRKVVELMHNPSEPYCIVHNGVWHKSIGHIIGSLPDGAFKFVNDERWWVPFPNYCNNPSDAWPIIVENKINIEWRDSLKVPPLAKGTGGNQCWHADKNPLRAAMICFLKMKDTEK